MLISRDLGLSSLLTKTPQIHSLLVAEDFHENQLDIEKDEVSEVMNVLQEELDRAQSSTSNSQNRRRCLRIMHYLNRTHGVLPPSMYLRGLTCESKTAVAGGGFADIWIGRWETRRVCIKVLRFFQRGSDRNKLLKDLSKEVLLWRQLKHPNILPFLGINTELFSPSFCIVSPWMSNGDIMSYASQLSLDIHDKLNHTIQIAEGIVYLHGLDPPVVHGDIKGANILISDDHRCCLADFGLSILDTHSTTPAQTATVQGSLRWLAPEFIYPTSNSQPTQGKLTSRDIYALGCTMLELLTGKPPFSHHTLEISVAIDVLNGVRPVLPMDVVPDQTVFKTICKMLSSCWSEQATKRPDAKSLLNSLRSVQDSLHVSKINRSHSPTELNGDNLSVDANRISGRLDTPNHTAWELPAKLTLDCLLEEESGLECSSSEEDEWDECPRPQYMLETRDSEYSPLESLEKVLNSSLGDEELDEELEVDSDFLALGQEISSNASQSHFDPNQSSMSGSLKRKSDALDSNISSDRERPRPTKIRDWSTLRSIEGELTIPSVYLSATEAVNMDTVDVIHRDSQRLGDPFNNDDFAFSPLVEIVADSDDSTPKYPSSFSPSSPVNEEEARHNSATEIVTLPLRLFSDMKNRIMREPSVMRERERQPKNSTDRLVWDDQSLRDAWEQYRLRMSADINISSTMPW